MSKPSAAQIEANRANSKHGHGPNTARGKARSGLNALRHGLTGRIVVLPTEDIEVYNAFSKELVDSLNPGSPLEQQFAQTIADTQWRLNRARSFEDGMIALGHYEDAGDFNAASPELHSALTAARVFRDHSKEFVNLSLYEQRLGRTQKEALRQLRELKAERKADLDMRLAAASVPASPVAQPRTMTAGQTINPVTASTSKEIGFVCSGIESDLNVLKTAAFPADLSLVLPAAAAAQCAAGQTSGRN